MHRRRRRGSPKFGLRLRSRCNRRGGPRRRGGAGWRGDRRAGDARSRLANGRSGSHSPDRGPGAGSRAGSGRSCRPRRPPPGASLAFGLTVGRYRGARRRGRRTPGARNRQGVGPRQGLGRRQRARRIGRQRRVRPSGLPRRRETSPRGRIDRRARRYRRLPCWISVALCATAGGSAGVRHHPAPAQPGGWSAGAPARLGASPAPGPAPIRRQVSRRRPPVDHVVDDGAVMDVGKDDVVRRRRHIARRPHIDRDRHKDRLRQDEQPDRRRRRLQHHEILLRRRQ